jgi:peptidoglycan/LPS O-acetylase OafA/YrhL
MITGFLFTLKAKNNNINWQKFYISRILRLLPLYSVIVFCVFLMSLHLSNWSLINTPYQIAKQLTQWITFVVFGRPDINGVAMTWTLIAGVNWSLKYEVLFYIFAVPGMHFLQKSINPKITAFVIAIMLISLIGLREWRELSGGSTLHAAHFLGGILVACAIQIPEGCLLIRSKLTKILAVMALISLSLMTHSYSSFAIIFSIVIFSAAAGGASMFGIFSSRPAVWLGDISYGIYLIHGLVIWIALNAGGQIFDISSTSLVDYFSLVLLITLTVLLLASASYVKLERPILMSANRPSTSQPISRA